jgi:hypothetical protein
MRFSEIQEKAEYNKINQKKKRNRAFSFMIIKFISSTGTIIILWELLKYILS